MTARGPLKVAVIAGNGVGAEVMPYGVDCLQAICDVYEIPLELEEFPYGSDAYYREHGRFLPENVATVLTPFDAIYFGTVTVPDRLPHNGSFRLRSHVRRLRLDLEQYISVRPCRLIRGVKCPLAGRKPGDIDFCVVGATADVEYSANSSVMDEGTDNECLLKETCLSRLHVGSVLKYAFDMAQSRPRRRLTSVTQSHTIGSSDQSGWWDSCVRDMAKTYSDVRVNECHIGVLAACFVQKPDSFDVVVGSDNYGDMQSDLGPACIGTLGITPSASISFNGKFPSLFEPDHNIGQVVAGKGNVNPVSMIWAGQMLLQHVGYAEAGDALLNAVENVLDRSQLQVITPDLGGNGTTRMLGEAIINEIMSLRK